MVELNEQDEAELVALLQKIADRPVVDDTDVLTPGPTWQSQMAVLAELERRHWVRIDAPNHGDGGLLSARDIFITGEGEAALQASYYSEGRQGSDAPRDRRTPRERHALRGEFMARLYEVTDGDAARLVSARDVAADLGWDPRITSSVVQYLTANGLVRRRRAGGDAISLTHDGVVEVEQLESSPTEATEHLPPLVVIKGDNYGPIQAGGSHNRQQVVYGAETAIRDFLKELRSALTTADLNPALANLAASQIETVESELVTSGPDSPLIKRLLPSLRDFGLNLAASGTYDALQQAASALSEWL